MIDERKAERSELCMRITVPPCMYDTGVVGDIGDVATEIDEHRFLCTKISIHTGVYIYISTLVPSSTTGACFAGDNRCRGDDTTNLVNVQRRQGLSVGDGLRLGTIGDKQFLDRVAR